MVCSRPIRPGELLGLEWRHALAVLRPRHGARWGLYAAGRVNGRVKGDGLEPSGLAALMRQGDRGFSGPELGFVGGAVTVGAGTAPERGAVPWLVRYDPREIEVVVKRGENAGRTLPHKDVAREMALLGHRDGRAASFPAPAGLVVPRRCGDRVGGGSGAHPGGG